MLTPQEVSSRAFAKAVMGGYSMPMVDEFLDELTRDYTAIYDENTALKTQLKALMEEVEENRAAKESVCAALLNAQKTADAMVQEAEDQKKRILEDAEAEVTQKIQTLREETAREEQKLREARTERESFLARVHDIYERELERFDRLLADPVPTAAAEQPGRERYEAEGTQGVGMEMDDAGGSSDGDVNKAQKDILEFVRFLNAGDEGPQNGGSQEAQGKALMERLDDERKAPSAN